MKNPFDWQDRTAQEAGKTVFLQFCQGCHGAGGNLQSGADFTSAVVHQRLGAAPDYFLWRVSEGKPMTRGFSMPPFKDTLSIEQRWQVITHLWALGAERR